MGASKRVAEMILQALASGEPAPFADLVGSSEGSDCVVLPTNKTSFVMVRFGNVLGSSGSVVPLFRKQLELGGPLTVTHPEVTRYFMTISEAVQLVLQAGLMGRGGETFVLDMGEPIRIADLARTMIRLSGFTEDEIPIQFTGLRPGEKLYEELLADGENTRPTHHHKVKVARAAEVPAHWLEVFRAWLEQERQLGDSARASTASCCRR